MRNVESIVVSIYLMIAVAVVSEVAADVSRSGRGTSISSRNISRIDFIRDIRLVHSCNQEYMQFTKNLLRVDSENKTSLSATGARTTTAEDATFVATNVFIKGIQRWRNITRCVR